MPSVSIVVRAKNEERYIGETLTAVQGQRYGDLEIVVVDSGSTDRTPQIAEELGARLLYIDPQEFTYGRALNLGVYHSRGGLVVSLSAHATPRDANWLGSLVSSFRHPSVGGAYGRHIPRRNAGLFELIGMHLSGVTSKQPRIQGTSARFSNTNGAFRRQLWEIAPFDESLPGAEDIEWARRIQRLGYLIAFEPTAAVYHSHGEPLLRLIRRQLHDQPVILRAWLCGLVNGHPGKGKTRVRGRESVTR